MVRFLSWFLILIGLLSLGGAVHDEWRGVADVSAPGRSMKRYVIARADDPRQFRNLMAYQWARGPLFLCGGLILRRLCRQADRLDPFSPDYVGSAAFKDEKRDSTEEKGG